MVYDQDHGFSKERTLLEYARDLGLINGARIAARYLGDDDSVKFNEKDIVNEYQSREEVREMFDKWVYPHLEKLLSRVNSEEELDNNNEGLNNDALMKIMNEE